MTTHRNLIAYIFCILVQLFLSAHYVVAKGIIENVDPISFAAVRGIIGGFLILAFNWKKLFSVVRYNYGKFLMVVLIGILSFGLNQIFFMKGLKLSTPMHAALFSNSIPLVSSMMAMAFLGEERNPRKVLGLILGYATLIFYIFGSGDTSFDGALKGDIYIMINVFLFSAGMVWSKNIYQYIPASVVSGGMLFFGGIFLSSLSFSHIPELIEYTLLSKQNVSLMLFEVVFSTAVVYLLNLKSLEMLDVSKTFIFSYLQVPITALIGLVFFSKLPALSILPTSIVLFLSVYLVLWRKKRA
ncbi:MAG: DMT family transporter [Bacteriovoracaceae bacterium]|jgi:drug/metabolite transporter (DMT)-like permease|nr:DMT family transporter [Bacteriovoracaceae bacterium]